MQSTIKANGDVIKQWELLAVLGADRALNALVFNLHRRIAAGARIQRGRLDVGVEAFWLGRDIDLVDVERSNNGPTGGYTGIEIDTAAKVAESEAYADTVRAAREAKTKRGRK